MHGVIEKPKAEAKAKTKKNGRTAAGTTADNRQMPRRVVDCLADAGPAASSGPVFDAFWREGELALMFGPSGAGKSLFAVQLADAIASGRGIDGFEMPRAGRNVLYVDLVMNEMQFKRRYIVRHQLGSDAEIYRFSRRFYRGRPADPATLGAWLRAVVLKGGFRVVIIDDLSAVKRTHDGTRETLTLMRELKQLKDETGISILVVTASERARKGNLADERDMGRSRVLADVGDTVFALEFHPHAPGKRYLIQTRSRNAPAVWNENNAPVCAIETAAAGIPAMVFDPRFAATMDEATRERICRIHKMRNDGLLSQRQIADRLGISVSTVCRLLKKWSPEQVNGGRSAAGGDEPNIDGSNDELFDDDHEGDDYDEDRYLRDCGIQTADGHRPTTTGEPPIARGLDVRRIPFGAGMGLRSVYDLPSFTDKLGVTYYVEEFQHHTNRPMIFYHVRKSGQMVKHVRKLYGIICQNLGHAPWLPRQ